LLTKSATQPVEFIVHLAEQADLSQAANLTTKIAKGRYVFAELTRVADQTQPTVVVLLEQEGVPYQRFWVANMIQVKGDQELMEKLARLPEVAHLYGNWPIQVEPGLPADSASTSLKHSPATVEWNIALVGGPEVWAEGNTGQAAVIGGIDTGYDWTHPALINQYRGWNGATADHNYNWHDAIHADGGDCGPDSPEPCDDGFHGTHTMGIMVGDDGAGNQIGLAPGASWIGCRCMDQGFGTPATYAECLQWMIAPTDLNDLNPDPDLAPDVINNSWVCPDWEGCVDPNVLLPAIEAVRAAGIVVVASAGNNGNECESVQYPLAIYDAAFSVGATDEEDVISSFSSRGPVTVDGSGRLKPDISAPGQGVRSCRPGPDYVTASGTSMAGPHVAGLVALLVTANPDYRGDVDALEYFIHSSAVPMTTATQDCGGVSGLTVPNNTYGYGRIDALAAHLLISDYTVATPDPAAVPAALRLLPNTPNPFNPLTVIWYELPRPALVKLTVHDLNGRVIRSLEQDAFKVTGRHEITWDGRDEKNREVPSGVYISRLSADGVHRTGRMTLVR
jgi:subtilisin family serine protease